MSEPSDPDHNPPLSPYDVVHREFIKTIGAMHVMVKPTARAKATDATLNQIDSPPLLTIFDNSVDKSMRAIREEFSPSPSTMSMLYGIAATQFEAILRATSAEVLKKEVEPDQPILINPKILSSICTELPNYYAVPNSEFYQDLKLLTPFYQAALDPLTTNPTTIPAEYEGVSAGSRGNSNLARVLKREHFTVHPRVETEKRLFNILELMHHHQHELFRAPPASDQSEEAGAIRAQVAPKAMLIAGVANWLLNKERDQTKQDPYNQRHELSPKACANLLMDTILLARDATDMDELKTVLAPNSEHLKETYEAFKAASTAPEGHASHIVHEGAFPASKRMIVLPVSRQ